MTTEHGTRRDVAINGTILRTVVGSGVHGIAIEGTDDRDEMGVYIEPPEYVIGTRRPAEHYIWRTQPEGARSGPGDLDLVLYSLRKYVALATKGNPTALLPLFAPESDVIVCTAMGHELRDLRAAFLSQEAVKRFLGYMHSQHERMLGGGKRNRVPSRPELVEQYGWDVKYGAHALRLAMQGKELVQRGGLTLPMREKQRYVVLAVKRGEYSRDTVSAWITMYEQEIRDCLAMSRSPLPLQPNWDRISEWMQGAHVRFWQGER